MLQLQNNTPFAADYTSFPNEQGVDTLYVIAKASFIMGEQCSLAKEQTPPQMGDEYYGEPGLSSIKVLSDYHTGKNSTDIIMSGNAITPNEQLLNQLDVFLSVGEVHKTVRVFGDREWQNGCTTAAKPFQTMPLVYERAFGGCHQVDENNLLVEERNAIGCGFAGKRSKKDMNGMPLPNLEDPKQLIQSIKDTPEPANFGALNAEYLPRRQWAGTYDDDWLSRRAPYLPLDFDRRFLNAAHPDLIYPGFIQGGEPILIKNMHSLGDIKLTVPSVKLNCQVLLKGKAKTAQFNIETLTLLPNNNRLEMVWLAGLECDKNLLNIDEIVITLQA